MAPALSANILLALAAAASWGGGDFSGGMGAKYAGGSARGMQALYDVSAALGGVTTTDEVAHLIAI